MQNSAEKTMKPKVNDKDEKSENGLLNLVVYYQNLFDRDENINHYSSNDYQNAKRKFVKYSLKNRKI
ncbi:MAG: hypothetical protein ACI8PB_001244 [Desulforhopalus sp.]|jgi:hypothetical protein